MQLEVTAAIMCCIRCCNSQYLHNQKRDQIKRPRQGQSWGKYIWDAGTTQDSYDLIGAEMWSVWFTGPHDIIKLGHLTCVDSRTNIGPHQMLEHTFMLENECMRFVAFCDVKWAHSFSARVLSMSAQWQEKVPLYHQGRWSTSRWFSYEFYHIVRIESRNA